MLTNEFFVQLSAALRAAGGTGGYFIAVGKGHATWDESAKGEDRGAGRLVDEVARKRVLPASVTFLNPSGESSEAPTARVQFAVTFDEGEATGTLRECGLFGGAASMEADSGTLLSYFTHPRMEKASGMTLSRTLRVDLTPRAIAPGSRVTRYLANTSTTELHDRNHATLLCQIDEIRPDRRYYFASAKEAVAAGYDYCAYCFDRERSRR